MSDKQRRKLIKTAALGGAILSVKEVQSGWVKPVVESVMLPAHAATSQTGAPGSFAGVPGVVNLDKPGNPLIDALVSEAHAQEGELSFVSLSCIKKTGEESCSVNAIGLGSILDAGDVPIGGDPVLMMETPCFIVDDQIDDVRNAPESPLSRMASLLVSSGLVTSAHAGEQPRFGIRVRVDSIGSRANGAFLIDFLEEELPFSLPAKPCQDAVCDDIEIPS